MRLHSLFLAALIAGASYYLNRWIGVEGWIDIAWKGAGVALLAIWARTTLHSFDGRLLGAALALGALGDVLLETHGFTVGGIAFLAGHVTATYLYIRNRGPLAWAAIPVALAVAVGAFLLPADRSAAPGLAAYGLGLGAMAGTAWVSRFPQATVGIGVLLFLLSDLLIFARMGPLAGSELPGLLIWPTYFAGQALIAWGGVQTIAAHERVPA